MNRTETEESYNSTGRLIISKWYKCDQGESTAVTGVHYSFCNYGLGKLQFRP